MRRILLLVLFVFVSGCCCLPGGRESASTTAGSTTTLAREGVLEHTTTAGPTTTEARPSTTTLPPAAAIPEYAVGDLWSYVEQVEEGELKPYERSFEVEYKGREEESGRSVFDRRLSGVKASPGQSIAMVFSTVKEYYRLESGGWILDKTVAYPKASTGGYTTYTYTPGRVILTFPLEAGASWNGSSELSARQLNRLLYKLGLNYRSSVTGVKEVSTPAGSFTCFEVETLEEQYLADRLIQTSKRIDYYCPDLKYYAYSTMEVTLPSGKTSDKIRIPQYQSVLEPKKQNINAQLVSYKTT